MRQQRRRADLVHPAADARHPGASGDGADDRRLHHPGHHPGPQRDQRRAGAVLGHHRLDVGRQPDAGPAEPAADRALGEAADHPLPGAVPGDHRLRLHRLLRDQPEHLRRLRDRGLRPARLRAGQARLRAGAAAARLRPRPAARGAPAPRHDHLPRRPDDLPRPARSRRPCSRSPRWRWSSRSCRRCAASATRSSSRRIDARRRPADDAPPGPGSAAATLRLRDRRIRGARRPDGAGRDGVARRPGDHHPCQQLPHRASTGRPMPPTA